MNRWHHATVARSTKADSKRARTVALFRQGLAPGIISYRLGYPIRTVNRYLYGERNG